MAGRRRLAELFFELRARSEGLKGDLNQAERHLDKFSTFARANIGIAVAGIATALVGIGAKFVQMARSVDAGIERLAASLPKGAVGVQQLQRAFEQLSIRTGRTQAELSAAAVQIGKLGVESLGELSVRLEAAVRAADASGTDLDTVIRGLDQTLDLFGISSDNAEQALATLFATARGKTGLDDLFTALEGGAKAINRLGADLPTAAAAITTLLERGIAAGQVGQILNTLAKQGAAGRKALEELAAQSRVTGDAIATMGAAAEKAADTLEGKAARSARELEATMIDLGRSLVPVKRALVEVAALFARGITGRAFALGAQQTALRALKDVTDFNIQTQIEAARTLERLIGKGFGDFIREAAQAEGVDKLSEALGTLIANGRVATEEVERLTAVLKILDQQSKVIGPPLPAGVSGAGRRTPLPSEIFGKGKETSSDAFIEQQQARTAAAIQALDQLGREAEKRQRLIAATLQAIAGEAMQAVQDQITFMAATLDSEVKRQVIGGLNAILRTTKSLLEETRIDVQIARDALGELHASIRAEDAAAARSREDSERSARDAQLRGLALGRQLEDIGRLTLAAADAFGNLNAQAEQALRAVIDVGVGIGRIFAGDRKGGSTQLLSGVLSGIASLSNKDPATAQRRREHAENLAVLRQIERHTGDLLKTGLTGTDITRSRKEVAAILAATGSAGGFRRFGARGPLRFQDPAQIVEEMGGSFEDLRRVAARFKITLNTTKQSFIDFADALTQFDLDAFGEGFVGAMDKMEAELRLEGVTDPVEIMRRRLEKLKEFSPAFAKALEGIDISTADGRAAAIAVFKTLFANLKNLTPEDLGGLSVEEFVDAIVSSTEKLRDLDPPELTALERFVRDLGNLLLRFDLLDVPAPERLKALSALAKGFDPNTFGFLGEGTSVDDVRTQREAFLHAALADSTISEAEQAILDFFAQIIDTMGAVADEAARAAAEADRAAAEARSRVITRAQQRLALTDQEGDPQAVLASLLAGFTETIASLGPLMERFKGATLDETLLNIFDAIESGEISLEALGVPLDEFLEAILAIEAASDSAAAAMESLAQQLQTALSDLNLELEIGNITDPLERLKATAEAIAALDPRIADVLKGFNLTTGEGRAAADVALQGLARGTTDPELKQAILEILRALRSVPGIGAQEIPGAAAAPSLAVSDVTRATEHTFAVVADLARTSVDIARSQLDTLRGILAAIAGPSLSGSIGAGAFSGGGAGGIQIGRIDVHVLGGGSGAAIGDEIARTLWSKMRVYAAQDVAFRRTRDGQSTVPS